MRTSQFRFRKFAFAVGLVVLAWSNPALSDPPSRAARLGYLSGPVSFSPAGEMDWVEATVNRPLTTGDRLWTDANARAEIQIGGAMFRLGADTGVTILNLDDRITQLQLNQGVLNMRVRRLAAGQTIEIATPNLAFTVREPGDFRIVVNPDGQTTDVVVRRGRGDAYGDGATYRIDTRQAYRFGGFELSDYRYLNAPRPDAFDRWARDRDRSFDSSVSARYVSYDVVGYEDLDNHGTWRRDATYGNVWEPRRVASGWTPYRDGHWSWIDPWGWTWIDDAPWGYAVSHYGRWANLGNGWAWVPGPVRSRAYYAPALVAFIGAPALQSSGAGSNTGHVAWFPLAPREVYRPSYAVSRGYYQNLNTSNTKINNTIIQNTYNTYHTTQASNIAYVNPQVAGAVVAVPRTTFVRSQPVAKVAVRVSHEVIASAPISGVAAVAPTEKSVHGAANAVGRPPGRAFERAVVARVAPPPPRPAFAAQLAQLAALGGRPLDEEARKELKPSVTTAPVIRLVPRAQQAASAVAPPPPPANAQVAPPVAGPRVAASA